MGKNRRRPRTVFLDRTTAGGLHEAYPRAYEKWTDEEDAKLEQLVRSGRPVNDVAAQLQRQPGAIRSRIAKRDPTAGNVPLLGNSPIDRQNLAPRQRSPNSSVVLALPSPLQEIQPLTAILGSRRLCIRSNFL
jgi:hypothetical protein